MATVVIDNGTGYSKMGYAGNAEPSYLIPTVVADAFEKVVFFLQFYRKRELPASKISFLILSLTSTSGRRPSSTRRHTTLTTSSGVGRSRAGR